MIEMVELDIPMFFILIILIGISVILKYVQEKNKKEINILNKVDEFCNKHYKKIWCIFAIILFITVIFQFGTIPTYMSVDEAGMAYDANNIANYGVDRYLNSYPLYLTNFGSGQSALCAYLAAFFIKIFGSTMVAYRLPLLIVYLITVIGSYLFISKAKDKKTALLFTFLIITCPWNIWNARQALDCNLFAGLFMISLYLMNSARKNYQFVIAGISLGITLYTYILSWISLPVFLFVWIIYMLYIKRIKVRNIIAMAIPMGIMAMPLIYFLLLNYGIVQNTQIGIFSLPILGEFRGNQIAISNIWEHGLESLKVIFLPNKSIYLMYVPLFVIGYVLGIKESIQSIKKKEFNITTVITIAFTTLLIGLLMAEIRTNNKANVLYIPILYFVTIAIWYLLKHTKALLITMLIAITMLFINFEYNYYTETGINPRSFWYEDKYVYSLSKEIEANEKYKDMDKYYIVNKTAQYIYPVLAQKMPPHEFKENLKIKEYGNIGVTEVIEIGDYHFFNYYYNVNELYEMDLKNTNYVFVISEEFVNEWEYVEQYGYKKELYGDLYILTK